MSLPGHTVVYEINTWVWLQELSVKYNRKVTLASIPAAEYEHLAQAGFHAVWLMGVWERSPAGIAIARQHGGILNELKAALNDFTEKDLVGSPYCIRRYRAEAQLGGEKGLAIARSELSRRNIRLILDFVPNHLAPDHPWTLDHPDYFIRGSKNDLAEKPGEYLESSGNIFARAKDPFFPPWPDVLQLNVFHPGLRDAMQDAIRHIAAQCDGIRCDMAMLVNNDIFQKTWGDKAGPRPGTEFWEHLIPVARQVNSDFLFIAEVYWDMEWEMMRLGFDFCYDKRLYDRLAQGDPESVRQHLGADLSFQSRLLRFIENHDENRAASFLPAGRHKALALASLTLPGMRLLHDGQLDGRTVKVPVFLGRRRKEPVNDEIGTFYRRLLDLLKSPAMRHGTWNTCRVEGWPENNVYTNLLAWEWTEDGERVMIIINLSDAPAQGRVRSAHGFSTGRAYQLFDVISGELYYRDGEEMNEPGLYAGLQPWGVHAFVIED